MGSFLATDSCEKSQSTLCRKSWVFSKNSGFLPQGKLTGWVRINIVKKAISYGLGVYPDVNLRNRNVINNLNHVIRSGS